MKTCCGLRSIRYDDVQAAWVQIVPNAIQLQLATGKLPYYDIEAAAPLEIAT